MDQLLEKLMISKAIMDKTEGISRGQNASLPNNINVQNFDAPQAKYNIPNDVLSESGFQQPTRPVSTKTPTIDAIKNSKLPDEIKKLMIEHPIAQPQQQSTNVLSDELVEKASRLMKEKSNNYIPESAMPKTKTKSSSEIDYNVIKKMIKETVEDVLRENGVISESAEKANEFFSFKVGKHIFEGKVTKIKKIQ